MPLTGGPAQSLVACVGDRSFDVAVGGVYYVACGRSPGGIIHRLNPATAEDRVLGTLNLDNYQGNLSVSPDETMILYERAATVGADLMLIENFR